MGGCTSITITLIIYSYVLTAIQDYTAEAREAVLS